MVENFELGSIKFFLEKMAKIIVRRHADPVYVRALHSSIEKIVYQKQCPNEDRIVKSVLQSEPEWRVNDILKQLKMAVKDKLITEVTARSTHGSTRGTSQTAYRLVNNEDAEIRQKMFDDTQDWYCWECHKAGEVILCDYCPRVFHKKCAQLKTIPTTKWKCLSCQAVQKCNIPENKTTEELSIMFKACLERMKENAKEFHHPVDLKAEPDYLMFVHTLQDLGTIEQNVKKKKYKNIEEFREDSKWIYHNCYIYNGEDDEQTDLAELVLEDCNTALSEIEMCPDCFLMSTLRPRNWFSKPCNPPHELVWAKMSGEPPWPAKLLEWNKDKTKGHVRFFGAQNQRAWISNKHISGIDNKPDIKKRSQRWLEAELELMDYQKYVNGGQISNRTRGCQYITGNKKGKYNEDMKIKKTTIVNTGTQTDEQRSLQEIIIQEITAKTEQSNQETQTSSSPTTDFENNQVIQLQQRIYALETEVALARTVKNGTKNKADLEKAFEVAAMEAASKTRIEVEKEFELKLNSQEKTLQEAIRGEQHAKEKAIQDAVKLSCAKERLDKERTIEKLKRDFKIEKERAVKVALTSTKEEFEQQMRNISSKSLDVEKAVKDAVEKAKMKQWCACCGNEAHYPCCWNTCYCTVDCQRKHWYSHMFQCTRRSLCSSAKKLMLYPLIKDSIV